MYIRKVRFPAAQTFIMLTKQPLHCLALIVAWTSWVPVVSIVPTHCKASEADLRKALTVHASFDGGTEANFALGDKRLFHAASMSKRADAKPGLPESGETIIAPGQGRYGDALRFTRKKAPVVFFQAEKNVEYRPTNWSGAVSFWLSVDPEKELEPGFCDPIQITPRAWNDAAFFVEFEKRKESIPFRLGVYSDFAVWNPKNRKWDEIAFNEKPLVTVEKPPFAGGKWTHIVFTWENFNTGRGDGVPKLYLDGKFQGNLNPRVQTFTWEPAKTAVMLGLSYIGLFDELSVFNRALSEKEIQALYEFKRGARALVN
jgi:hypothetical protein